MVKDTEGKNPGPESALEGTHQTSPLVLARNKLLCVSPWDTGLICCGIQSCLSWYTFALRSREGRMRLSGPRVVGALHLRRSSSSWGYSRGGLIYLVCSEGVP